MDHLGREVEELIDAALDLERRPGDVALQFALSLECADVLAWLIAVANLRTIDLDDALTRRL